MSELAAHLERVADDVTDKLANAAAFYTMEYMAAKERGEHMPHGLDSVLKPIVAAALAACAREEAKPLIEALTAVEELVADDFCHDLSMRKVRGEKKLMAEKLAVIYRVAHACNPEHSCHHVHDDWRKEAHTLAAPAIAEREASRSVVEKAGKNLLGILALERAVGEKGQA